jgi:MFS family permease
MKKFSWIKDSLIQIIFISFAVVFTVMIAHISISEQYSAYYDAKITEKAENLTRNATMLFGENPQNQDEDYVRAVLDMVFHSDNINTGGMEVISYTLEPLEIRVDDTPFAEYSEEMLAGLRQSLFRGCLFMAAGIAIFAIISNVIRKKMTGDDSEKAPDSHSQSGFGGKIATQVMSMLIFGTLALLFWFVPDGVSVAGLLVTVLFAAFAAAHLIRLILWGISHWLNRPISTYAAQTTQFFMFLLVFLSLYSFSMQNRYSTQIELSRLDELQTSSIFAALAFASDDNHELCFGESNEFVVITRSESGEFSTSDYARDLLTSAWESRATVAGIRGGFKYGITPVLGLSESGEVMTTALVAVRQLDAIQADEMRDTTIEFLLEMTATVFAFVFLFVEINRLLEAINLPNLKRERRVRYGSAARGLMFFATLARYIPLYFFVLIVNDLYERSPISWLPQEWAVVLPIIVVLFVMVLGNNIAGKLIRLKSRAMMVLGCFVGIIGFVALTYASNLPLFLLLLTLTYTGVSMVYSGLWSFTSDVSGSGHDEYKILKEQTFSSEYLGGMAGAVIGAIVFDKLGLFAAFGVSAGILLILAVLIRALLPKFSLSEEAITLTPIGGGVKSPADGQNSPHRSSSVTFWRFLFSRRVFLFITLLLLPFIIGEYFIEQFTPLYAESISLSPGAASWSSLLMTISLAYFGTPIAGALLHRTRLTNTTICVFANIISAAGMLLFAFMPGIVSMYIASALIGVSIGIGGNLISSWYDNLDESERYRNSGYVYELFGSLFGQLGAVLFTIAHVTSDGSGRYIMVIGGVIVVLTIFYVILANIRGRNGKRV